MNKGGKEKRQKEGGREGRKVIRKEGKKER